jgi:hypothetical protein
MFDTAIARDTFIVDDPDEPQSQLEEEDVHRIVNGERHKMTPDQETTSCGTSWNLAFDPPRPANTWKEGDPLCSVCFTPFELAQALAAQTTRRRRATDEFEPLDIHSAAPELPRAIALKPRRKK